MNALYKFAFDIQPVFITYVSSGKFAHPWIISWLLQLPRLMSSRLYYVISILSSCPLKNIATNYLYHTVVVHIMHLQQSRTTPLSSAEILKQLRWLPIEWRIQFKLAVLNHKALLTGRPPCLADLLQHHKSKKSTHTRRLLSYFWLHDTT